jgi:glycosyltransferase involved in cell wall biosynthesis
MRILKLSDHYPPHNPGGAQEVARRLAKGYLDSGHEVEVLSTLNENITTSEEFERIKVHHVKAKHGLKYLEKGLYNSQATKTFLTVLDNFKPDVIHAHNTHSALGWGWVSEAKKKNIPIFFHLHDHMSITQGKLVPPMNYSATDTYLHGFWKELQRYRRQTYLSRNKTIRNILSEAEKVWAVSKDLTKRLTDNGLKNIETCYNGIDPHKIEFKDLPKKPSLLFLGRPTREKGLDVLAEAIGLSNSQWLCRVAGSVSEKRQDVLKKLAKGKTIEFVGWLNEIEKINMIDRSWLVANLSTYPDPFNLSNVESMARARSLLATVWGGTPEIVRDGLDGWLLNPRNLNEVVDALNSIATQPEEVALRGKQAELHVHKNFSWEAAVNKCLKNFEEALEKN